MQRENKTQVTEFILLGFSIPHQMSILLFVVFLIMFLFTFTANGFIITVIRADLRLHSPMYFFICNLSFLDVCFLSSTIPTCLRGFLWENSTITLAGCVAQMYIGFSMGATQGVLLAVMAWDRYVAICNPLNYHRIVNKAVCITLAMATWASGFLIALVSVSFTMAAPFCGPNKINHVVCEVAAVLRLACIDIHFYEVQLFVVSVIVLVAPLSLIIFTYLHIISTIMRMPTAAGRHKAFSTCGSHLMVVSLFYGTTILIYMSPRSMISTESEKVISLMYGLLTPTLNPLIYSLRNNAVKGALKKLFHINTNCQCKILRLP